MQETETETPTPTLGDTDRHDQERGKAHHLRVYLNPWQSTSVDLTTEQLQAIVDQAAQRGITPAGHHPAPF